jgi:Zn-dependent protease with chaperone function
LSSEEVAARGKEKGRARHRRENARRRAEELQAALAKVDDLLGHELGHLVNGDATGSLFVWSARNSLRNWQYLFTPTVRRGYLAGSTLGAQARLAEIVTALAMLPIYCCAVLLEQMFAWLQVHVSLRAEYLADEMSARVGGTEASLALMRKLTISRTVGLFLNREKMRRGKSFGVRRVTEEDGAALWAGLDEHLRSVPEHEYERQVRVSEFRGTAADDSHPATYLRMRLLRDRPHRGAAFSPSEQEWEAVERELYPHVAAAGAVLAR